MINKKKLHGDAIYMANESFYH